MRINFQKVKHALLAIFLVASTFLQSGCAFKDMDKRIFVMAIGIDYSENEEKPYRIVLKLAVPSGEFKKTGGQYSYLTNESTSLAETLRILKTHVDKEMNLGHAKIIVIGESLLNKDLKEVMDFFLRRSDIQMISWVAVGKPSAESVLRMEPQSESAAIPALFNFFDENGAESAFIVTTYLFDFRRRMLEGGIDPILPVIETNEEQQKLMIKNAVVLANKKEPVTLTSNQTKDYNLLAKNTERLYLKVKRKKFIFSVAIDTTKIKYKILTPANKPPVLKLDVYMAGIIEESIKGLSPKEMDVYSKLASKVAKSHIQKLLNIFQENGVDPLGFGLKYKSARLHNKNINKEWEQLYPTLTFDISVNAAIKSTGTIE